MKMPSPWLYAPFMANDNGMANQQNTSREQQQLVQMKREYDRLDIKTQEAKVSFSRSSGNMRNRSLGRTVNNVESARLDYEVTMNNIARERERLDMKYGNGPYASLPLTQKERQQMVAIQAKYDRLSYQEDLLQCQKKKERVRGITGVLDRKSRIGEILNNSSYNDIRRDIRLDAIQRERENLDILHGGEPKSNLHVYQTGKTVTDRTPAPDRINRDCREIKQISLEELTEMTHRMKENDMKSPDERMNRFNGEGRGTNPGKNMFKEESKPDLSQRSGLHF